MPNFDSNTTACYFTGDNRYMIVATPQEDGTTNFQVFSMAPVDFRSAEFTHTSDEKAYDDLVNELKTQYDISASDFDEIYRLLDDEEYDKAEDKALALCERIPREPELSGIFATINLGKDTY